MSTAGSFYPILLFVVGPIYAAAPFAWAFVVVSIWSGRVWSYTLPWKAAFIWAALEVAFSLYHRILARRIANTPAPPPPELNVLQAAFARVLKAGMANLPDPDASPDATAHDQEQDEKERGSVPRTGSPVESIVQLDFHDPRAEDFRERMRTWFHKKPWSEIHVHEMHQWIYWSTFNAHLPPEAELSPVQKSALDDALHLIEKRAGATLKQGSNPACQPITLTLDPVIVHPRPLVYYTLIWAANFLIRNYLQKHWGLQYGRCGDLEYLVRIPNKIDTVSTPRPIVFLHGLGLGLFQYNMLLRHLIRALPSHPLFIPLQPHISQNIFHPRFLNPLPREESVNRMTQAIRELGWEDHGVDMLSHSNGSFFHAWILKSYPDLIKRSCFVDPVTFCSWEGDVCYNFVHRPCLTGIELIIRYFVGTELGVVNVLQRKFDWSANSLWFEEIPGATNPRKAAFFLGGKDSIVDAARVKRYLRSHGVRKGLWFDPNGRHGQALMAGGEGYRRVLKWLLDEE